VPLLLARIDDRLIHGQVVHGWGGPLRPTWIGIVSDPLRADPRRADLYLFAAPEGARAAATLHLLPTLWHRNTWSWSHVARRPRLRDRTASAQFATIEAERSFLLFPGPEEPLRLKQGGFPLVEVNVGGLHHAEGKVEVLPYIHVSSAEREALLALERLGVRLTAQDLPTNPARNLAPLLGGAA